jgi:hypothetical protein
MDEQLHEGERGHVRPLACVGGFLPPNASR